MMNLDNYLNRINYHQIPQINIDTLKELHRKHFFAVPFENLDISLKKPLNVDVNSLYKKVVIEKRGGFCYELNFLFYHLLKQIGFDCQIISARMYEKRDTLGAECDHLAILVKLEENWLIDVGYGNLFSEPMKICRHNRDDSANFYEDRSSVYKMSRVNELNYILSESRRNYKFEKIYMFDTTSRKIEEFNEQIRFKQYSKESYFVKNRICTVPTKKGRITLFNNKFIKTTFNKKEERTIQNDREFYQILRREFDITIASIREENLCSI